MTAAHDRTTGAQQPSRQRALAAGDKHTKRPAEGFDGP
jgi:hypothetical protein